MTRNRRARVIAAAVYFVAVFANAVLGALFDFYPNHLLVLGVLFVTYMTWSVSYGHRKARRDRERAATGTLIGPGSTFHFTGPGPVNALTNINPGGPWFSTLGPYHGPGPGAVTDVHEQLVPEREDSMPFLAYKRATFEWIPNRGFTMRSMFGKVELDADAVCTNDGYTIKNGAGLTIKEGGPHDAPILECNCGFHAVKRLEDLHLGYGNAVLDVELSGRVVVHEAGYRAAHQRVLRVRVPGRCLICGDPAVCYAVGDDYHTMRCEVHVRPSEFVFGVEEIGRRLGLPFEFDAEMEFDPRMEIGS